MESFYSIFDEYAKRIAESLNLSDEEVKRVILTSVKYHNKYEINYKYLDDLKLFDYKLELLSKTKDQEKYNTLKRFIKERIGELIC